MLGIYTFILGKEEEVVARNIEVKTFYAIATQIFGVETIRELNILQTEEVARLYKL